MSLSPKIKEIKGSMKLNRPNSNRPYYPQSNNLIDSGVQISTITFEFVKQLGLKIYQLDRILKFETTGHGDIPYMGYVQVNLKIPEIKTFNVDVHMLVIEDSTYVQQVPIQLGTLYIDRALNLISEKEITQLSTKWK